MAEVTVNGHRVRISDAGLPELLAVLNRHSDRVLGLADVERVRVPMVETAALAAALVPRSAVAERPQRGKRRG